MKALDQLQDNLRNLNQVALARIKPGDVLSIQAERARLQAWLGGVDVPGDEMAATIENAILGYEQSGHIQGARQLRLICYGCTESVGAKAFRLIEDYAHFEKLLDFVDRYHSRPRTFRQCYRGLLNAYFSYDPYARDAHPAGCENWRKLRQFLATRQGLLHVGGYAPEWIEVLDEHAGLLGEFPAHAYKKMLAQGDHSVLATLGESLGIGENSWLFRLLILASVEDACYEDDAEFKEQLANILLLLNDYPLYADTGLTLLLDRYAKCSGAEIDTLLRDYAVKLWGNPWLAASAQKWQCGSAARRMVARWLKQHLLAEYFSLLSDDDAKQARRFNFWSLYCDDIQGMYFALGKSAFVRGTLPLHKFRRDAKGLIVRLSEEKNDLHACIMQFEHRHAVEFNHHNNVAYFYDSRQGMPGFYLSKGWLEVGALSVINLPQSTEATAQAKQLRHQDSRSQSWEGRFAHELGVTEGAIAAFCQQHACRYEDARAKNGYRWIRPSDIASLGHIAQSILEAWGFALSGEQNTYFLKGEKTA
ncbi:MAG: EH signature domain-containing protein [Gallionella sp.]|nr:EH signature domain-containing protein [Gallionella sp.]